MRVAAAFTLIPPAVGHRLSLLPVIASRARGGRDPGPGLGADDDLLSLSHYRFPKDHCIHPTANVVESPFTNGNSAIVSKGQKHKPRISHASVRDIDGGWLIPAARSLLAT
jgi:hypothetical protein